MFDVYAMFPEGSYLVASGTDANHTLDFADRIMKRFNIVPYATATAIRGEHVLRGEIFSVDTLVKNHGRR